ncbi:hypothetical protein [Rhodoglobus vestalii]|nr:hypothetical protein [Rhodoglobus vestalii]
MKTVSTLAVRPVIDWIGHTASPNDLDMQTLCNGDQHTVGGSLNRADYLITATA